MARRKRHHTVTRALLAGFAEDGRVIGRRRRIGSGEFLLSISDATVESDFYASKTQETDDTVEDWLGTAVEAEFAALLPGFRDGMQPSTLMGNSVARFVAVSVLRTRTARSYMGQIDRPIAGTIVLSMLASVHDWSIAEMSADQVSRLRHLCQQIWESSPSRLETLASQLRSMIRESNRIENRLRSYAWAVLTAPESSLLIGDAPVVALGDQNQGWKGMIPDGTTVFLPLSPRAVLMGSPEPCKRLLMTEELVKIVNGFTMREAYDVVMRHPATPWPPGLALGESSPRLPEPSFTVRRSDPNKAPTYPCTYRAINDAPMVALLKNLGSIDTVE